MEFAKFRKSFDLPEREDRSRPRIGRLIVSDDFASSDGKFYPDLEVFGTSPKGEYPLFGQFTFGPGDPYLESVTARIPGTAYEGGEYEYVFHIYGFMVPDFLKETEFRGVRAKIELDPPFYPTDDVRKVGGYDLSWREEGSMIRLEIGYDQAQKPCCYLLDGERNRGIGILRFSHEYSVVLGRDLSFEGAHSIDCGETSRYDTEAEFEAAYPGVLAEVRKAADDGLLTVQRYRWNGRKNEGYVTLYKKEATTW